SRCHATVIRPVFVDLMAVAANRQSVSPAATVCIVPAQLDEPDAAGVDGFAAGGGACVVTVGVPTAVVPAALPAVSGASTAAPAETKARNGFRGSSVGTGTARGGRT